MAREEWKIVQWERASKVLDRALPDCVPGQVRCHDELSHELIPNQIGEVSFQRSLRNCSY